MERFRQAVDLMRDFIGIQPRILFVISFISLSAPGSSCNTDDLRRRISILECYLVMTIVCSAVFTQCVRMVVETDVHSRALRTCRHTNEKVVKEEPKHGISCIAGWEGKVVRPCFCLAIACSYGFSVCAIFALDLSLKLFGCVSGSTEIIPFAVVGVPFFFIGVIATLVHGFLGWVAITQD